MGKSLETLNRSVKTLKQTHAFMGHRRGIPEDHRKS